MEQGLCESRREQSEQALAEILGLIGGSPDLIAGYLLDAIDRIGDTDKQKIIGEWAHGWFGEGRPGRDFLRRLLSDIHPNVRQRYVARMVVGMLFRDWETGLNCVFKYGITPPYAMLISPTMRCNYLCRGCYAASYKRYDDMKPEVFDRVLGEAEDIGINFFTILGGEPFIYPELLPVLSNHSKSFYQVYTNGSLIDKAMAGRLADLGYIGPQLSVNGPAEYTDDSRGRGSFDRVMAAMDDLREAGCVFGFSSLVTRRNLDAICSEEWFDLLVEKGALYGWLFLYMPVGDKPDMSLMPTPEQRNKIRAAVRRYRNTKPILPIDFWNDGPLTGGCIAGGRLYFHVNSNGDVEPCIFCHFATHNVNTSTLAEALGSPFFTEIKESQPFSWNTLRPCPIIDHPQEMWRIIREHGARPTHPGAEEIFAKLGKEIDEYASGVQEIMDEVYTGDEYLPWAPGWAGMCGIPPEKLEARRKAFEESKEKRPLATAGIR